MSSKVNSPPSTHESDEEHAHDLIEGSILMGKVVQVTMPAGVRHAFRPYEFAADDTRGWIHTATDHYGEHVYTRICERSAVREGILMAVPDVELVDEGESILPGDGDDG